MASYNELQVGRYNRLAQKLLSLKGPASLTNLSADLVFAVPLFYGSENRYLEGWDRFALVINQGAVAAQKSAIRLRNPGGSNVIAAVEKITVYTNAADNLVKLFYTSGLADLATAQTAFRLDSRGRPNPTLIPSSANNVADPANLVQAYQTGGTLALDALVTDIQEIPLTPGDALTINTNVVNVQLVVNLIWRERFLEDSERA